MKRFVFGFLGIVMVTILSVQYAFAKDLPAAKNFKLKDMSGNTVVLEDYKGKQPVILLFWTTWCPYCRKALNTLSGKYQQLAAEKIELLAINIGESEGLVANFLKKNPLNLKVCLDERSSVAESYSVLGIPTYIIVNKGGFIVFNGHTFPEDYLKLISQ